MNDMPKVFSQKMVKCRKPTKCCECFAAIGVGEQYECSKGIWHDGGAQTYKTCASCAEKRKQAAKDYPPLFEDEGPAFGQLQEYIAEMRY